MDLREDRNHHNEGEGEIQQHEEYVVLVRRHDLFHDFIHDLLGVVAEAATRSEATRWWFCFVVVLCEDLLGCGGCERTIVELTSSFAWYPGSRCLGKRQTRNGVTCKE